MKNKMTWDEFKKAEVANEWDFHKYQQTKISCPICGEFIYKRMDIVLTTYPLQYRYECKCGWVGLSYN